MKVSIVNKVQAGRLSVGVWEQSHTSNGNVNDSTSNVANQTYNGTNPNSSLSYLNVNNSSSNTNSNISSQLLFVELEHRLACGMWGLDYSSPLGERQRMD